jgi:hypothetical protein
MPQAQTQDYFYKNIRSSAALTGAYVAATKLGATYDSGEVSLRNQLVLYVSFTIGSLTTSEIKVEFSHDDSTWYQESFSSITTTTDSLSLGVHQLSASGNYRIAIPIKDRFVKVSVKGTGDVTGSAMSIGAVIGIA